MSQRMASIDTIQPAFDALDTCVAALGDLDMRCCAPGRSPRMAELGATLTEARVKLRAVTIEPTAGAPAAVETLEDAGAQVGRLQIGCCAPDRTRLYAEILETLTLARRVLSRVIAESA